MRFLQVYKSSALIGLIILLASKVNLAEAKRKLVATSLVTCMENSQLSANSFDVVFNPDDRSLHYDLDMSTQIDSYIFADIDVYAYGFKIITKNVDLCSINWKQFCPVHPGNIQIDSIEYISSEYVNEIPGIAYQVPDIDAYARVKITNNVSEYLACIQIYFSNGKTVSQIGVKWATAVVAGIGLLLSAILSTFGNSTAASHISANTMSLFLYFQSVVVVAMQHVHRVPPIAAAWAENLVWSMGLIRISFMQRIFRWYVQSTGGTPSLYLTSTSMSVLAQRSWQYLMELPLIKRATNVLYGNANTLIFRGIKRLGYKMGIENTSIVCTGFTFFVLCGYVLAGFIIVFKCCVELATRLGWIQKARFWEFRKQWRMILKGALLRYIYIGFVQLTILSFWEFTERDSPAVIVIACLFILLSCGLMLWAAWRTFFFARRSVALYNNPAALLYGDEYVLHKYGFFYTMFNANHYWWNIVLLSYIFVKSLLVGFAQASGQTQVLFMFILDLFYFVAIIYYKPYLDRPTNIMNILIATVTVVNSFLFMFFSDLFNQSYKVAAIMGWIFFIMNAAFSFILLMMILAFAGMMLFSKNPDLRFKPAKDDRTSFQRNTMKPEGTVNRSVANELLALGNVAKDHDDNSDYESNDTGVNDELKQAQDETTPTTVTSSDDNKPTFSEKILSKFSRPKNENASTDALRVEAPKQQTFPHNLTNLSRENLSTLGSKPYPGHTRSQSDAHNGLINSFEEEDTSSNTDPFHDSTEGDLLDTSSSDGGFRSQNYVRDDSINSLGNNKQPLRKPPGFFDEGFM
ncbi:HLJ1_G0032190.mRNA.1.CDS.1 [Saccharomyces cerevisiae]|nr:HLJ1_G0032190.mRNA.1.CDS.1 [Saccharomyces cerevisiae]